MRKIDGRNRERKKHLNKMERKEYKSIERRYSSKNQKVEGYENEGMDEKSLIQ